MRKKVTAKQFYSKLKDKSRYKVVNDLFIVRYIGKGIYEAVGEYSKKGSLGATPKTAFIKVTQYAAEKRKPHLFHPKKGLATTSLGAWTRLGIGFRIKPISEILK